MISLALTFNRASRPAVTPHYYLASSSEFRDVLASALKLHQAHQKLTLSTRSRGNGLGYLIFHDHTDQNRQTLCELVRERLLGHCHLRCLRA